MLSRIPNDLIREAEVYEHMPRPALSGPHAAELTVRIYEYYTAHARFNRALAQFVILEANYGKSY